MRSLDFLDELVPNAIRERASNIVESPSDDFECLVEISGLDPKHDFKHSDLEGVDFSNSNLKGFNFEGADLRGCIGINVMWDDTTILKDAAIDCSIFSHPTRLAKQFQENEAAQKTYRRVSAEDIYGKSIWLHEAARTIGSQRELTKLVALKIFHEEENVTVRNTFVYNARDFFEKPQEYRDFLTTLFSEPDSNENTIRACLSILAKTFNNDKITQDILFLVLKRGKSSQKLTALNGLTQSRSLPNLRTKLREIVRDVTQKQFRLYIRDLTFSKPEILEYRFYNGLEFSEFQEKIGLRAFDFDFIEPFNEERLVNFLAASFCYREYRPASKSLSRSAIDKSKAFLSRINSPQGSTKRQVSRAIALIRRKVKPERLRAEVKDADALRMAEEALFFEGFLLRFYQLSGIELQLRGSIAKELKSPSVARPDDEDDILYSTFSQLF